MCALFEEGSVGLTSCGTRQGAQCVATAAAFTLPHRRLPPSPPMRSDAQAARRAAPRHGGLLPRPRRAVAGAVPADGRRHGARVRVHPRVGECSGVRVACTSVAMACACSGGAKRATMRVERLAGSAACRQAYVRAPARPSRTMTCHAVLCLPGCALPTTTIRCRRPCRAHSQMLTNVPEDRTIRVIAGYVAEAGSE